MVTLFNAERKALLDYITNYPADIGRVVGFPDLTDLHNGWLQDMVLATEDFTLQAHRGSYKTTCISIALSMDALFYPRTNTIFMRKTGGDVTEVIRQSSKILHSDAFKFVFKKLYGYEMEFVAESSSGFTLNNYDTTRGAAQLLGVGTVGSLTGKHADRVMTDDIVNLQDRASKAERDRVKSVYQELQNIRNRGGLIINTGTPWHKDDAFTLMPNIRKYDCYQTGLLTDAQIQKLKSQMTNSLFAANYELRHVAADDVIFTDPQTGADPSLVEQGTGHIDAAYHGEDFTAYTLVHKVGDTFYVLGRLWRKHIDDVEDEILALHNAFNGGKIFCEDNADKGYLGKDLRKRGQRVVIYTESMNKYVKITSHLKFVWGNVVFVAGTDQDYIDQICDYNDNAEHDDAPDSLASLIRILAGKKPTMDYKPIFI